MKERKLNVSPEVESLESFQESLKEVIKRDECIQSWAESLSAAMSSYFLMGFQTALQLGLEKIEHFESRQILEQIGLEKGLFRIGGNNEKES